MQVDRKVLEQVLKTLENAKNFWWTGKDEAITALKAALLNKAEPLGPGESWEYDDGLTMNRSVYRHGKLVSLIPIEIIQDTPQMRPFRVAYSFGNREHRPSRDQEPLCK